MSKALRLAAFAAAPSSGGDFWGLGEGSAPPHLVTVTVVVTMSECELPQAS